MCLWHAQIYKKRKYDASILAVISNKNYKHLEINTLSERLKHLLERNGLTNYHFCKKVNISQSTISRILNKNSKPSTRNMQVICNYFNVSEEWFLTGKEKESTTKGVKSTFELEIEKIVAAKLQENEKIVKAELQENQKELHDLNKKLDVVSEALSELILEREERKILKGIKRV